MVRQRLCLVLCLLLAAFSPAAGTPPARANGAPMYYAGFTIQPGDPNTQITLERERVEAWIEDDLDKYGPISTVHATFWLRNTGEATTQIVGFPAGDPETYSLVGRDPDFAHFVVSIDGTEMAAEGLRLRKDGSVPGSETLWRVWEVSFARGETKVVRVEYSQQLIHGTFDGNSSPARTLALAFHYVLVTGRGWKGPIGRADISVTLPAAIARRDQVFVVVP